MEQTWLAASRSDGEPPRPEPSPPARCERASRQSRRSDSLLLLKVSDYGCRGLTGPEFPEDGVDPDEFGNFIRLCRLDLFSGKDKASGGSFGLGKAVYWRFSRLQTVLFNSCLYEADAVDGQPEPPLRREPGRHAHRRRQWVTRAVATSASPMPRETSRRSGRTTKRSDALQVARDDTGPAPRPSWSASTTPTRPSAGSTAAPGLIEMAKELQAGVEEYSGRCWRGTGSRSEFESSTTASHARRRRQPRSHVHRAGPGAAGGSTRGDSGRDPRRALLGRRPRRPDQRSPSDRTVRTTTSRSCITAKLVVTLSDDQQDSLENRVCLSEVPRWWSRPFTGRSRAGRSTRSCWPAPRSIRTSPSKDELRADDFLRFAEPPAHDRWIPGSGRYQASQANLTARYVAPWIPNLKAIETSVLDALFELFGDPPVARARRVRRPS